MAKSASTTLDDPAMYQTLTMAVLEILNDTDTVENSIGRILETIHRTTGIHAVGIRLCKDDDFPYFCHHGFPDNFILTENSLAFRNDEGTVCRDAEGCITLECTCGKVLCGKIDPSNPLYTEGGSAWTNDAQRLLDVPSEQDPQFHPRNRCIHEGYRSVALIPIRNKKEIVGLLQLNDRRRNRFTLKTIRFFERLNAGIGIALMRRQLDDERAQIDKKLRESELRFRALIENSADAVSLLDADGHVLYNSPSYQRIMGYSAESRLGRNTFELVHPDDRDYLLDLFARILHKAEPGLFSSIRVRHGDGSWRWLEGIANNMLGVPAVRAIVINFRDITERKQAELALRQSEEKFRSITEQTCDMIAITDSNGVITFASAASQSLFQFQPEEMCGRNFMEFIEESDIPRATERFKMAIERGIRTENLELTMRRRDGSVFIGELNGADFHHGDITGTLIVIRDITERKQAELALNESEEQLLRLSDNLPGGMVYQIDSGINGELRRISYVSAGVVKLHGITQEEALNDAEAIYGQVIEDDRPVLARQEAEALVNMSPLKAEVRIRQPSGAVRWSLFSSCPRRLSNGHLVWDGIEIDITERKLNEEDLKKSHIIHTMITENAADFLWTYGIVENRFTFVSDSVLTLRGFTPEEVLTQRMRDALTAESFDHVGKLFHEMIASRKRNDASPLVFKTEVVWTHKNGGEVATEVVATSIFDRDGKPVVFVGITRDITEKLRLQESVQRADKLEAIGLLAGGIAHDFNNLLGGIYGYMDMAHAVSKDPAVTDYLEKTLSTMNRARGLTHQLLTFAKGGAPVRKIEKLTPFLEETAQFALSGSNVSCSFDVPPDLWPCNFDRNQIAQVIENLVINAQQAMPRGGSIDMSAQNLCLAQKEHPPLAEGRYVKLCIHDRGIGIPKENLSRIFDPFFTTKSKGHGLGLATCYSIVNRHGGCIEVESELGAGSTFHVYLPASADTVSPAETRAASEHRGTGTIVIMDDERVIRDTFSVMLKTFGYTVVCKENGRDVVEYFLAETEANHAIVAMIFDLTVAGGMGGKEAIRAIRKKNPSIPVFVASGYADDPVMAHPADYGFTASICKPFTLSELGKVLNDFLKPAR